MTPVENTTQHVKLCGVGIHQNDMIDTKRPRRCENAHDSGQNIREGLHARSKTTRPGSEWGRCRLRPVLHYIPYVLSVYMADIDVAR
jgi:hypothetical protein